MAKYNYDSLKAAQAEKESTTKQNYDRVYHFGLWDEKPSAIVRFDVSSPNDLEIVDVHRVKIAKGDKAIYREVACLREDKDDFAKCPLCKQNVKTRSRKVYVKLLEYAVDNEGKVVVKPAVWERYNTFADELVSNLNDYGDLRECLFKVTREKVNDKVKYSVKYQPDKGIYTEEAGYIKDFSAFDNFLISKHSYMERTFDELETFVKTGEMASRKPASEQTNTTSTTQVETTEQVVNTQIQDEKAVEEYVKTTVEKPTQEVVAQTPTPVTGLTTNSTATLSVSPDAPKFTTRPTPVTPVDTQNDPTTVRRRRYNFDDASTPV